MYKRQLFQPTPWRIDSQEEKCEPEPELDPSPRTYPLPKVLEQCTNADMLSNYQLVSHKYQQFLTDAEDYYIKAFEISPNTAKEYRGRGLPPKFRTMTLHPPLPPDQIHASPYAAQHHAMKIRLKELGMLMQFPPHMHEHHRHRLIDLSLIHI